MKQVFIYQQLTKLQLILIQRSTVVNSSKYVRALFTSMNWVDHDILVLVNYPLMNIRFLRINNKETFYINGELVYETPPDKFLLINNLL